MSDRALSLHDVRKKLSISYGAAWLLVRTGQLHGFKAGRGKNSPIRVEPEELEKFKARNQIAADDAKSEPRKRSRVSECVDLGIDPNHEFVR